MSRAIQREVVFPQPREQVWRAATGSAILAEWMHPNGMEARVGHRFTFRVPPNPRQVSKAWPWAPKCWSANRPAGSCSRGRPQLGAPPHPPSTRKSSPRHHEARNQTSDSPLDSHHLWPSDPRFHLWSGWGSPAIRPHVPVCLRPRACPFGIVDVERASRATAFSEKPGLIGASPLTTAP